MSDNREIVNKGWASMADMLDQEMPVQKNKRRWIWIPIGVALLTAIVIWSRYNQSNTEVSKEEMNSIAIENAAAASHTDESITSTINNINLDPKPATSDITSIVTHNSESNNNTTSNTSSARNQLSTTVSPSTNLYGNHSDTQIADQISNNGNQLNQSNNANGINNDYNSNTLINNIGRRSASDVNASTLLKTTPAEFSGLQLLPVNGLEELATTFELKTPSLLPLQIEPSQPKPDNSWSIGIEGARFSNAPITLAGLGVAYHAPVDDKISMIGKLSYYKSYYKKSINLIDLVPSNDLMDLPMDHQAGATPEIDMNEISLGNSTMNIMRFSILSEYSFNDNIAYYGGITGAHSLGTYPAALATTGRAVAESSESYNRWLFGYTTGLHLRYQKIGLSLSYSRLSRNVLPTNEYENSKQYYALGLSYRI